MSTPMPSSSGHDRARRELLFERFVPMLGQARVALRLDQAIALTLDPSHVYVTLASGLGVDFDMSELGLLIESLRIDLTTLDLELETLADTLGEFENRLLSIAARWVLPVLVPALAGAENLRDVALGRFPLRDNTRILFEKKLPLFNTPLTVALANDVTVDVQLDGDLVSVSLRPGLRIDIPWLPLTIEQVSYRFDRQQIELVETAPSRAPWVKDLLLKLGLWFAHRWLRKRLPAPMGVPGYNFFDDAQRRQTIMALINNLRPTPKRSPSAKDQASSPSMIERLRSQGARPSPELDKRSVVTVPTPLGPLHVCVKLRVAPTVSKAKQHLAVHVRDGVWIEVAGLSTQHARILGIELDVAKQTLALATEPPVGSLIPDVASFFLSRMILPLAPAVAKSALDIGASPASDQVLFRFVSDGGTGVDVRMASDAIVTLEYHDDRIEVACQSGIALSFPGLNYLPGALIVAATLDFATGAVTLALHETNAARDEPVFELGAFGQAAVTGLYFARARNAIPPMAVPLPSTPAPRFDVPVSHKLQLVDVTLPVLGPLAVFFDPTDTLTLTLQACTLNVTFEHALIVTGDDINVRLDVNQVGFDLFDRTLTADASLPPASYGRTLLARVVEKFALPLLTKRLPLPASRDADWTLFSKELPQIGTLSVILPATTTLQVTRHPDGVLVQADGGLVVQASQLLGTFAILELGLTLPSGEVHVVTDPPVGAFVPTVATQLLRGLAPAALFVGLERVGLPGLDPDAYRPPALPSADWEVTLDERTLPSVGTLLVSLDIGRRIALRLEGRELHIEVDGGLRVQLPELELSVMLEHVALNLGEGNVALTLTPEVGELERRLVENAVREMVLPKVAGLLPSTEAAPRGDQGQVPVLSFGQGQAWGPVEICVVPGEAIVIDLDDDALGIRNDSGIYLHAGSFEWLPSFYLHHLEYSLGTGEVDVEISGIEEEFYHEEDDVSPLTEEVLEHLMKAIVAPKLPPWAEELGIVGFADHEEHIGSDHGIRLAEVPINTTFGSVLVNMDDHDELKVSASLIEVEITSQRGLVVQLPALQVYVRIEHVRYHLESGEVQVDGLGRFENAMIESLIVKQLGPKLSPRGVDSGSWTLSDTLDEKIPTDKEGRRQVASIKKVGVGLVEVYLHPDSEIVLVIDENGLRLDIEPALLIDLPIMPDYTFSSMRYDFATASCTMSLDGKSRFSLGSDTLEKQAAKRVTELIHSKLPEPMRVPGYSFANNPDAAAHITQLIRGLQKVKKATG